MRNLGVVLFFIFSAVIAWYVLEGFMLRSFVSLILVLFSVQMLLNEFLESYMGAKVKAKYFNLLIAPGTIIHEASHALVAKLTGCEITNISFFNPGSRNGVLGFVQYTQPVDRFKPIRQILIGFAPFFGCGFFLVAILNYLALQYPGLELMNAGFVRLDGLDSVLYNAEYILSTFYQQLLVLDLSNIIILLILYLEFAFALGSVPSPQDINGAFDSVMEHKIEALSFILFMISLILFTEYAVEFIGDGQRFTDSVMLLSKWFVLILMLSTAMLLAAIPLTYIAIETFKIDGPYKIIPPVLFIAVYYLTRNAIFLAAEISLLSSLAAYLLSLLILRKPGYFMKN